MDNTGIPHVQTRICYFLKLSIHYSKLEIDNKRYIFSACCFIYSLFKLISRYKISRRYLYSTLEHVYNLIKLIDNRYLGKYALIVLCVFIQDITSR